MNKREYLAQLERELKRNHVPDAGEILNEYAQHFAFKLADGYSEEEISARLGEPAALAAQFDGPSAPPKAGNKPLAAFMLCGSFGGVPVFDPAGLEPGHGGRRPGLRGRGALAALWR